MKKKILLKATIGISLILTGILSSMAMNTSAAGDFKSGTGEKNDPYIITNAKQLQNVGKYCGKDNAKYFKIDIKDDKLDMKDIQNFKPICSLLEGKNEEEVFKDAFYGHFDGNNVELINFKIETDGFFGGLFGATNGATIKNIGIGKNSSITVKTTSSTGNSPTGGIIGETWKTKIENVWNTASIAGRGTQIGGIVGMLYGDSTLKKVKNSGNIHGGNNKGELSGTGGIVGYASDKVTIEDVSNTASITGEGSHVGGIVGELSEYSTLRNALNYNENITGSEYVGLLIGVMSNDSIATATNAYTLKENTTLNGVGWYHNEYSKISSMKGFTKEEMKNKENFVGFDFDNIWIMGEEHPELERKITIDGGETISGTGGSGNTEITIKYNTNTVNVSNYLYKNRTYVDLYTFCSESGICEVHKDEENEKIYKILKSESLTSTDGQKKYHYLVEHESGTSNFKSTILIGGRSVVDDINTQLSANVTSCPIEVTDSKYQCSGNTIYVPVRFLTQALGLRVEWDGDTNTVTIKNNFEKTFNDVYTPIITEGKCEDDISSCTLIEKNSEGNYELEKDKTYYLGIIKKDDKTIMEFKKFFSFYEEPNDMSVTKTGKKEPYTYTRFTFSIRGPEIKVGGSREQREDIAQIIMYEIATGDDVHDAGSYPMLINGSFTVK
ncbi:MAG: hypothetical protein IJO32_04445 [Bacilli bacterium]|nr:hypothetical protein [Bacilli bacterium]